MKHLYIDCFAGISGDMMLGALVDSGLAVEALETELRKLHVPGWALRAERVTKQGIAATKVDVVLEPDSHGDGHDHGRSLRELTAAIEQSGLATAVQERSVAILRRIAAAEAKVHGTSPEEVHFHEVGGLDSLVDIVGSVVGLHLLGIETVSCRPVPLSHGYVTCAHGTLPVPPPAVVELLQGVPTRPLDVEGETVTPTGAGLAVSLATCFGAPPPMRLEAVGYGAGSRDWPAMPNVLRLLVGEVAPSGQATADEVVLIQANIDDMPAEQLGAALEQGFAAGALDVWMTPIQMKKNRPGTMLSALADPDRAEQVVAALFRHTTTFGLRRSNWQRSCLPREQVSVETPYGAVRVKVGRLPTGERTAAPEYDDCLAAAQRAGVAVREVYHAAVAAWRAAPQASPPSG